MHRPLGLTRVGMVVAILLLTLVPGAAAQLSTGQFITGVVAEQWRVWSTALEATVARNTAETEAAFGELLDADPSPLRVALLAEHAVLRSQLGGAVLLLEQDAEADALGANAREVFDRLTVGREQLAQADDAFYFSQIGRFDVALANFQALLAADPDPVALLEFTDRVPRRREILLQLLVNEQLKDAASAYQRLLDQGERRIKADPTRVRENIQRLAGTPRGFENAVQALKDSGEYAIPFLVEALRDSSRAELLQPILRFLPAVDREALNPLVMALRVNDHVTKRYLIQVLGKTGYAQPVPYLLAVAQDPCEPAEVQSAAQAALAALQARGVAIDAPGSAADAFLALANDYYADKPSLAADVRLDVANVWYWRDNLLQNIEVPTPIFNEIMCMRCCEETLRLKPDSKPALGLWLAANFRRAAQLNGPADDRTRPEDFPTPVFFAQSAGPEACLLTLSRAVDTVDPAVALGAIEALRNTAGPASLVTEANGRLPLAEALLFPDRLVRIQAALTLGRGRPVSEFHNYQNLMPVLAETLALHGGSRSALVIDADTDAANAVAGALRAQGYEVLIDTSLFAGLEKTRATMPALDVILLSSAMQNPGLTQALAALRAEYRFATTPVVILTHGADVTAVRDLVRGDFRLASIAAAFDPAELEATLQRLAKAVGAYAITPELGHELAMEAAEVLRLLALTRNPLFDVSQAETALRSALQSADPRLRLLAAEVLGYIGSAAAQEAIATIALDADEPEELRIGMFAALAEAAKQRGPMLSPDIARQIIALADGDARMELREAASQALGALNLSGAPASQLVREYYRG